MMASARPHHDNGGIDAQVRRRQRDALRVIASRAGNDAGLKLLRRELGDFVVCPADLEREYRLQVLPLQQDGVVDIAGKGRCCLQRRLMRNVVDACVEDLAKIVVVPECAEWNHSHVWRSADTNLPDE